VPKVSVTIWLFGGGLGGVPLTDLYICTLYLYHYLGVDNHGVG
jgi:hypothetical protein